MKRSTQSRQHAASDDAPRGSRWWTGTFWQAAAGSLLLFAALPPLAIGPLAWVAPVPWLLLIRRDRLPGRRPYLALWLAGVLFWLLSLHWLRLPHPATSAGWIAVALYLGCYLPLLVAVGRAAVHTLKVPLWIAAPVAWVGLELARAHMLTGFLMASLAHSQVRWPELLQVADLAGEYAVDFLIVLVAACLAEVWVALFPLFQPPDENANRLAPSRKTWRSLLTAAGVSALTLGVALVYGHWRVHQQVLQPGPLVALIQGNILAEWKADPARAQRIMNEYTRVSIDAVREARRVRDGSPPDLVVWPETMFRGTIFQFAPGYHAGPDGPEMDLAEYRRAGPERIAELAGILETPLLLGVDVVRFVADPGHHGRDYLSWNAAVLADEDGTLVGQYAKVHLVIFGEYIPFADYLPWLYGFTPLTGGVTPGEGPVALPSRGIVYAPNICYESVLPHVIRRQVTELTEAGTPPDVLVNLTNDAWYWGSSELDMHLACDVMRAIENRTPHLVAANGGISAQIDACGRIVEQSPRQETDFILADVQLDPRTSLYARIGDWPAGVCLAACIVAAVTGLVQTRKGRPAAAKDD